MESLDPDGGTATYSLTQAPAEMGINSTTGVLSWEAGAALAGQSFPVTVRVDDGHGGFDEQRFTVTVGTGTIRGQKWHDRDADGTHDPDEPYLAGWTIYLDLDGDASRDADEPFRITDGEGRYEFVGLPPGDYVVREQLRAGWEQTYPEGPVGPELVVNGDFEESSPQDLLPNGIGFVTVGVGAPELTGWSVFNNTIDIHHEDHTAAATGVRAVDLVGNSGDGGIRQVFETEPGVRYRLSFQYAGNPRAGNGVKQFRVNIGDETREFSFSIADRSPTDMGFQSAEIDFVATGTSTTLAFESFNSGLWGGPIIDAVSVRRLITGGGHLVRLFGGETISGIDFGNRLLDPPLTNAPPQVAELAPEPVEVGEKFTARLNATDPDGDGITFGRISGPAGLQVHATLGVVAWVPSREQLGTHQVVLRATDTAGNVTLVPVAVTVVAPNTAPVFTSAPPAGPATGGLPFEYHANAQDAEQKTLAYSLAAPQAGMAIDRVTGVFTWTPTADQIGRHSITLVVSDDLVSTEQTFALEVVATSTNRNPTLAVTPDGSAWLGRVYGTQLVGSDPDGDPVRYELVSGPAGMTVDAVTGILRWEPDAVTTVPHAVEVRAIDGRGGSASATFQVGVHATAANRGPVVVSTPPQTAQVGQTYAYDLTARDPDGDRVLWLLVEGPQGTSLDPIAGTLRWTPAADQTGPQTFTVRALDPLLAAGEQTFTVQVSCENRPPRLESRPPTLAHVNEPYLYAVRATDPERDPLTFALDEAPAGMAFDSGTSLLRWTPTLGQAGPQDVVVRVTDQAGNVTTQAFTVEVSTESPNRPPVVTSRPVVGATLGRTYTYTPTARDPDGDALSYSLTEKPAGMEISPAGVISWTPTTAGPYPVTVEIADGRGGVAVQAFLLTARPNQAPTVTPPAGTLPEAAVGSTFRTAVRATDPEGDPLTFTLEEAPAGMTIDGQGRINWVVNGPPRTETVRVSVADGGGLATSVTFPVRVVADTQAPAVQVTLSQTRVGLGSTVQVQVLATDNVGVAGVSLLANGVAVALDANNRATLDATMAGRITLAATANDASGNTATAQADLVVFDPSLTSDVRASITRLDQLVAPGQYEPHVPSDLGAATDLSYLTDVIGTVETVGQPLDHWLVLVARADEVDLNNLNPHLPAWKEIGRGTAAVTNGKLATFDPTLLTNDQYVLAVVAYDVTGAGTIKPVEVNVVGSAKLGEFRLEFTDLSIPLNGIPVEITRVYDTRDAGTSGDFGYGWTLGVRDARIRETVPGYETLIPDRSKVYLNAPDGTRVGFTYKERLVNAFPFGFGAVYETYFVADAGHHYKLEAPDDSQVVRGGIIGALGNSGVNPVHYRLTSPEGMVYDYDQYAGLQKIADRNGNTVTFEADAIRHSGGQVIALERDGQGRITAISRPDGQVALRYRYDAKGDLVEVKQVTATTPAEVALTSRITYRTDRAHYLDEYFDANGNRAVKTEYDASGRLKGITDALDNTTGQEFDPTNFTETVKDARGNPTAITYNERGNVTRTVQPTEFGDIVMRYEYADPTNPDRETKTVNPRGFATTHTFDVSGNLLTETTPDGTTVYRYSEQNKLLQVTDTLGRVTAYDYSPQGNLTRVVNALGDDATFAYDGQGHVTRYEDFAGNVTLFQDYCACGRPLTVINPDGSVRRYQTNALSQIIQVTDEEGNVTKNEYDLQGRLIRVEDGEGHATKYEYEGTNQKRVIDGENHVTEYVYDKLNRRTKIIDAEGGVVVFGYDANGNQTTVTDPVGNVTTFVYDMANRVKQEIDPLTHSRYFEYDPAGNRTRSTDRNGRVRTFEYDAMNRVTAEKWIATDGSVLRVVASSYDDAGNLLATSDPDAQLTWTYDALNRMKTATTVYPGTSVPTAILTYAYDPNGNTTGVVDNFGVRVESNYDGRNRLETRVWSGGGIDTASVRYGYRDNGEVEMLTRYAGALGTATVGTTGYEYWRNGLSKNITHTGGTGAVVASYGYLYDDAGRLKQETHHGETFDYGYDKTGQLKTVIRNGSLFESFDYDANGNRQNSTGPNGSQTYEPPGAGNRLLNDGLFRYTYDDEGNLRTKTELATGNVTEYTWDHRSRLTRVEQRSSGGVLQSLSEYAYDAIGRRILQRTNGTVLSTVYNGEHAWADVNAAGSITGRYLFGDRIDDILARWTPGGGTAWYLKDKLGTVHDLLGATGAVINHIDYSVVPLYR